MDLRKRQAAEAGYAVYRTADPAPSLDQINEALQAQGMAEIRPRTLKHYRRLALRGQNAYIPINEFDIALKHRSLPASGGS